MSSRVLIAGIGNIFARDDAFGVEVVHKLAAVEFPASVRLMDIGIRSVDLAFALLDDYDLAILVDATSRGGKPGTLYTLAIGPEDIPVAADNVALVNSHGLNPVHVLALAKSSGAKLNRILLVGCEPQVLDTEASGHIGLSEVVQAAVNPAIETVSRLIDEFTRNQGSFIMLRNQEVCSDEHV